MGSFRVSRSALLAAFLGMAGLAACGWFMSAESAEERAELAQERARSDAEVLLQLEKVIAEDEARRITLSGLEQELAAALESATDRFDALSQRREGPDQEDAGVEGDAGVSDAGVGAVDLEEAWKQARAELNELLQRRRAVAQQVEIVEHIIEKEKEAVELITMHRVRNAVDAANTSEHEPAAGEEPAPAKTTNTPALPFPAPLARTTVPGSGTTNARAAAERLYDPDVSEAARVLQKRAHEVELVEHRIRLVEQLISLVQDDLNLARMTAEASGEPADQRQVNALERRLTGLRRARAPMEASLRVAEQRAERARQRLEFLESPFSPQRLRRWITRAGPRLLSIVLGLLVFWALLRQLARRLAASMIMRSGYASDDERVQRVDTVQRAAKSGFTVGVFLLGTLVLLPEFGVDITVLLGSAAVFSLAIAFGAQSLIKDYFAGVTILLENQYRVGNVVSINGTTGVVEDITLRMTTLRDLHGTAHFVPHGQITNVSNLTHVWSRVVLDVRVAYREDVDRVIAVLRELGELMRTDPEFGHMIIEEPEMLGVNALDPNEVVVRLLVKTRPLKQWLVKRELLRRIKVRFDALGIEQPFPQRKVHISAPVAVVTEAGTEDGSPEAAPLQDRTGA